MSVSKIFVGIRPIRASRQKQTAASGPRCQWEGCENSSRRRCGRVVSPFLCWAFTPIQQGLWLFAK